MPKRDPPPDDSFAQAKPSEPAALPLARARVADALFGMAGGFGRFRVLDRLGAGAMGVVYAAYDPDLDRGVALKFVRAPDQKRSVALAEAKTLARLSHPNVVPIYDVGVEGAHVYLVMELVRGETLRMWAKSHERPAVLDAYRQAGEALAAAHAAGIIHRDFKPDNAIVGSDGRVRVVDFGLACEVAGQDRGVVGTPRYMAPEQAAGTTVTEAADQYSFAVSLTEALTPPLPRWLDAVLERGRAADPAVRFPSMRELLRALARDPVRRRQRRIVTASLVAVVAGALALGRANLAARQDTCEAGSRRLATLWPPAERDRALARVAAMGPYGRTLAARLEHQLGDHEQRFASGYRDACLARRHAIQSDALVDRRMVCLDRTRAAWQAVAEIVNTAGNETLPELALAVRALPDPDACSNLAAIQSDIELPPAALAQAVAQIRARIEDARVQIAVGRFRQAQEMASRAVSEARATGYRPLVAEALLAFGHATMSGSAREQAIPALTEAMSVALAVGADAQAVEAWARRAWVEGSEDAQDDALAGLDIMASLAARTPSPFARALLHNNVGGVELEREHRDRARAEFERALEASHGITGPGAVELVNVRLNLARVTDDPVRRDRMLADAESELSRLLGAEHPQTLEARLLRAAMTPSPSAAAEVLAPTCSHLELHEGLASRGASCWSELGHLRRELGDHAAAKAALERALRSGDPPSDVAPYLLLWQGQAQAAASGFARALAETPDRAWWDRYQRAVLALGLGQARRATGELRAAQKALTQSVGDFAAVAREHPSARLERWLARARAELALTKAGSPK